MQYGMYMYSIAYDGNAEEHTFYIAHGCRDFPLRFKVVAAALVLLQIIISRAGREQDAVACGWRVRIGARKYIICRNTTKKCCCCI